MCEVRASTTLGCSVDIFSAGANIFICSPNRLDTDDDQARAAARVPVRGSPYSFLSSAAGSYEHYTLNINVLKLHELILLEAK